MRDQPPPALAALLARLGIVARGSVVPRTRALSKIARHVLCESLWIDALLRGRRLTPFQAAEIHAGRGERLRLGPYVLLEKAAGPVYVGNYRTRHVETGALARLAVWNEKGVRTVFPNPPSTNLPLPSGSAENSSDPFLALCAAWGQTFYLDCGREGDQAYLAAPWRDGQTAAELLIHHGRFPSGVVLEIARSVTVQLAAWEQQGLCHGDISMQTLLLSSSAEVELLWPGLRGLLRGAEGFSRADLAPEAYDALAPERVSCGNPPTIASDLYACGCVWWHLLSGRPPLPGGDGLSKLRSVQTAAIPDVRRFVSDVPDFFAEALAACLQAVPHQRPASMARLAERLGPPTPAGKILLPAFFRRSARPAPPRQSRRHSPSFWPAWFAGLAAAASLLFLVVRHRPPPSAAGSVAGGCAVKSSMESRDQRSRKNSARPSILPEPQSLPQPLAAAYQGSDENGAFSETIHRDDHLERTSFIAGGQRPTTNGQQPPDFLLTPESVSPGMKFRVEPGQRVIGKSGRRIRLPAGETGVVIVGENVRFENVDFVAGTETESAPADTAAALVVLHSRRAEFRGCTFQGQKKTAIRWAVLSGADRAADRRQKVRFTNCIFRRLGAGIDCRLSGPLCIEANNVLFLGNEDERANGVPPPWILLPRLPQSGESLLLRFRQATFRESGAVLEAGKGDSPPFTTTTALGEITVEAEACIFAIHRHAALLSMGAPVPPDILAKHLHWTGAGSLVPPRCVIARRLTSEGQEESLDDTDLSIAGLVRSTMEFAGPADADLDAQRVIHWQAPIASPDPPGVAPDALPRRLPGLSP